MWLVIRVVSHAVVDFLLGALANFIDADGTRAVQVFGLAQHAIAHELRSQTAFEFIVKTDLVISCRTDVNHVLGQYTFGGLFHQQVARLDVDRSATLFRDARKLGPQRAFIIGIHQATGARRAGALQQTAGVASVIHDEQLVGAARDGLEQIRHFTVGDLVAVVGQQRLYATTSSFIFITGSMPGIVDKHAVAGLHALCQVVQCLADIVAGGLVVLQVFDIAQRNLHRLRHLCGRNFVDAGSWQRRGSRVCITAHTNHQRMAIDTWRHATNAQSQRHIAGRFTPAGQAGGTCVVHLQTHRSCPNPASLLWRGTP